MLEANAVKTPTPHDHEPIIKISVCKNRLEFQKAGKPSTVTREALHRLLDRWIDDKVRDSGGVPSETELL